MKRIEIKIAHSNELREKAQDFFSQRIFESYGNKPSPLDEEMEILLAISGDRIIGTIGLYFEADTEVLPHQKLFKLPDDFSLGGRNTCFISRWSAVKDKTGLLLSYVSADYILSKDASIGFSVLKPKVANYLNSISGNSWDRVSGTVLVEGEVKIEDKHYFLNGPSPFLYKSDIQKYFDYLSKNKFLKQMMKEVEVKIK